MSQYCPNHWASESALISFHDLPFSEVKRRVEQQQNFITDHQLSYDAVQQKSSAEIEGLCQQIKAAFPPYKISV